MEKTIQINKTITTTISEFFRMAEGGGTWECHTPDGWQPLGYLVIKTDSVQHKIEFESGLMITTSKDHLFEVLTSGFDENHEIFDRIELIDNGVWIRSKNLKPGDPVMGAKGLEVVKQNQRFNSEQSYTFYDFEVLHPRHRYWSNGLCSHNTGKSAIAEGLAQRISQRKCSRILFDKRVVMLDLASIVSGTKYRGQFEERIKAIMAELEKNPDVILFIDEIHTMVGAGSSSGSLDASNMFKPALARGEIQIIGATTLDEYRKHIEKDGALERRFQKVIIEPATDEETLQILNNIKEKYEAHHNVTYSDEAIKACVDLTSRFMTDRFLPDKAIDALDEVGSRVHMANITVPQEILDIEKKILGIKEKKGEVVRNQKYEEAAKLRDVEKTLETNLAVARRNWEEDQLTKPVLVTEEDVAEVVSLMTGIPLQKVSQKENVKLSKMNEVLGAKVVGQKEAVDKVSMAIQRGRVGMKDPNKPLFCGLMLGPSGVGKTELAKQLAKYLFDSEDAMIRIDMSEYMEKISVNRIIGSPSGYLGYDDVNLLDKVRRKPFSVILLDEVEKAHPDVYNIFLQAFDDGHMTDSHGRKVNFKNCVILMTSNIGVRQLRDFGTGVGFMTQTKQDNEDSEVKGVIEKEIKKKFAPEFINRLDEIIYFNELSKENILEIVDLELSKTFKRARQIGFELHIEPKLKEHLVEIGYDKEFGARPLKRAIQKWIDNYVTQFIIENNPPQGSTFMLDYDGEFTTISIKEEKKARRKK